MPNKKDLIIWGNVATILQQKGWSLVTLAKEMGVTPQAINSLKTSGIGIRSIKKLARALSVDEIQLLAVNAPARRLPHPIPVISWVHAGNFAEASDMHAIGVSGEGEPVHSVKTVGPHAFALRVEGDSMLPRYMPGDIIVVDPALVCDNESPCVVLLNGEATFKFFKETNEAIILMPMNDKYPEIVVRKDSKVDFRVVGKVVDLIPQI